MSNLLSYESFLVDIGVSVADWKLQFETALTGQGWQIFDSTAEWTEFIPPTTQTIGIPYGNGVLRVYFDATTVTFQPRLRFEETRISVWQMSNSYTTTSSSTSYISSVTIGGVTWTGANDSPYTQNSRTESLYNALVADTATYPDGRDAYNYTLRTDVDPWAIEFTRIDPSTDYHEPLVDSYTNLVIDRIETSISPNTTIPFTSGTPGYTTGTYTVNIDLASGFIYYLSIFERSIVLATKTTVDYYGPIAGTWIENQLALDQTPQDFIPVELYTVDMGDHNATGYKFDALPSHSIGYYKLDDDVYYTPEDSPYLSSSTAVRAMPIKLPFGRGSAGDLGELCMLNPRAHEYFNFETGAHAGGVNSYYGDLLGPVYPIVNVELFKLYAQYSYSAWVWAAETTASFLEDVYMYTSTATNESLHLARIVDITTDVTATATDADTAITVTDTSLFPSSGTIIVNDEIIQYTSKTATSFGGLTRGQYGSVAGALAINDVVYATNWFVKINDGAILAGYAKPTAQ